MGLDIIQGDHEDAPGQLELNTQFDDVLRNADRLTTYRQICAQVAREDNLIACFMSKPFMGVSASGCHHNMSLWRGGEDEVNRLGFENLAGMEGSFTYRVGGENTFMPDPSIDDRAPGPIGLHCIGGVIKHLGALTSIGSSTVNSYRRLWDTGFWAPIFADWGYQNRTCALRVSAPGRFEYRSVDSMVNPYLMGTALLKAFDCRCHSVRRSKNCVTTKLSSRLCRVRCTGYSSITNAMNGSDTTPLSPTGTWKRTWTAYHKLIDSRQAHLCLVITQQ